MELDVERGIGYVPIEQKQKEKLAIGVIAIDAIFSPVKLVNFAVENIRVGQRIDFNKVTIDIETDGSIEPEEAIKKASEILVKHFEIIGLVETPEKKAKDEKPKKKVATKKKAK